MRSWSEALSCRRARWVPCALLAVHSRALDGDDAPAGHVMSPDGELIFLVHFLQHLIHLSCVDPRSGAAEQSGCDVSR